MKHSGLRPCRHAGPSTRLKPRSRFRADAPAAHSASLRALLGPAHGRPTRPRPHMDVRRRPSALPHCDHKPVPGPLRRLADHIGGFGFVCIATYTFMIGSMIVATILA